MLRTARLRRLPVRACEAHRALADLGSTAELARWIRGVHGFEVRADRLACEVRHSVAMDAGPATRLWWLLIGRPMYDLLIEDAFDSLARKTGSPVRRPARWTPYARVLRRMLSGDRAEGLPTDDAAAGVAPLPLAG